MFAAPSLLFRLTEVVSARYAFRPKLLPTLAFLIILPLLINLGLWQYGKAEKKQALQNLLDSRSRSPAVQLSATPGDVEALSFHRVVLRGEYEPARQILIDNRVYRERAGYSVVTPFKLAGSEGQGGMRVLINRGWIPAPPDHRSIPQVVTPAGQIELTGLAVVPSDKFFTLAAAAPVSVNAEWQPVWQNLDLKRFRESVPYAVQPVVVLLGADTTGDSSSGFAREWPQPDENVAKNLSYAFQWFGFAGTLVVIYLAVNLKKIA